jgi:hypothetical protein
MGYPTRMVIDWTDHVWVEVRLLHVHGQRSKLKDGSWLVSDRCIRTTKRDGCTPTPASLHTTSKLRLSLSLSLSRMLVYEYTRRLLLMGDTRGQTFAV